MKFIASIFLFFIFIAIGATACKKGGSTPAPPTPTEENLVIAIDPDPGATIIKALGTSYDFRVIIQSKMPANGVTINITYRKDADNSVISSQNLESSTTPVSVTINNITADIGTVTVTVTSKTKGTNTATKSFKLVKKV